MTHYSGVQERRKTTDHMNLQLEQHSQDRLGDPCAECTGAPDPDRRQHDANVFQVPKRQSCLFADSNAVVQFAPYHVSRKYGEIDHDSKQVSGL